MTQVFIISVELRVKITPPPFSILKYKRDPIGQEFPVGWPLITEVRWI